MMVRVKMGSKIKQNLYGIVCSIVFFFALFERKQQNLFPQGQFVDNTGYGRAQ